MGTEDDEGIVMFLPDSSGELTVRFTILSTDRKIAVLLPKDMTGEEMMDASNALFKLAEQMGKDAHKIGWDILAIPLHTGREAGVMVPKMATNEEIQELCGDLSVLSDRETLVYLISEECRDQSQEIDTSSLN